MRSSLSIKNERDFDSEITWQYRKVTGQIVGFCPTVPIALCKRPKWIHTEFRYRSGHKDRPMRAKRHKGSAYKVIQALQLFVEAEVKYRKYWIMTSCICWPWRIHCIGPLMVTRNSKIAVLRKSSLKLEYLRFLYFLKTVMLWLIYFKGSMNNFANFETMKSVIFDLQQYLEIDYFATKHDRFSFTWNFYGN